MLSTPRHPPCSSRSPIERRVPAAFSLYPPPTPAALKPVCAATVPMTCKIFRNTQFSKQSSRGVPSFRRPPCESCCSIEQEKLNSLCVQTARELVDLWTNDIISLISSQHHNSTEYRAEYRYRRLDKNLIHCGTGNSDRKPMYRCSGELFSNAV